MTFKGIFLALAKRIPALPVYTKNNEHSRPGVSESDLFAESELFYPPPNGGDPARNFEVLSKIDSIESSMHLQWWQHATVVRARRKEMFERLVTEAQQTKRNNEQVRAALSESEANAARPVPNPSGSL